MQIVLIWSEIKFKSGLKAACPLQERIALYKTISELFLTRSVINLETVRILLCFTNKNNGQTINECILPPEGDGQKYIFVKIKASLPRVKAFSVINVTGSIFFVFATLTNSYNSKKIKNLKGKFEYENCEN